MIRGILRRLQHRQISTIETRWRELHGDGAALLIDRARAQAMTAREMLAWHLDGLVYMARKVGRDITAKPKAAKAPKQPAKPAPAKPAPRPTPKPAPIIAKMVFPDIPTPEQPIATKAPNTATASNQKLVATLRALGMTAKEAKERAVVAIEARPDADLSTLIGIATETEE